MGIEYHGGFLKNGVIQYFPMLILNTFFFFYFLGWTMTDEL